ncbi:hypothetical protein [Thiorhodospira sibirica]|uniref:hypothetical protein n=1 Tax=Thiorhodospira sibirica TaxID=154347 RepID=UPI00022C0528|nr:hypothetical protein [Thiorhodospira sibirica]
MNDTLSVKQRACAAVENVYARFMAEVIEQGVFADRLGEASELLKKRLAQGTHIDSRHVRLMLLSGKGGWDSDPERAARYAKNRNVTLLDHLLSVARGAMLLAALDWLLQNPDMDETLLLRQLAMLAALGILHDLDKDQQLVRDQAIPLQAIAQALQRYRLDSFLAHYAIRLGPEQVRYLIVKVEGTQAHRHPDTPAPREMEFLPAYVALADKLDGIWLKTDPSEGGLNGVIQRLRSDQTLSSVTLRDWYVIDIYDPHHPFLLDELQRWLSYFSKRLGGIPPLIEQHQDGRLFMLIPDAAAADIIRQASVRLVKSLPFGLEMTVSVRGLPQLHGLAVSYVDLDAFVRDTAKSDDLAKLFAIKADQKAVISDALDALLENTALSVQWPTKNTGLISPFSKPDTLRQEAIFSDAALLALLLHLKVDLPRKSTIPDSETREAQLLAQLETARPAWLEAMDDGFSRRSMTALWVSVLGAESGDCYQAIWGETGLLQQWLEGNETHPGLASGIQGKGTEVNAAVQLHVQQLLGKQRVAPPDESGHGRCLFTNAPVALSDSIDSTSGLYEVKKSAFSGRDGRPESLLNETGHTNVSAVSLAEHKLRKHVHELQGGKAEGIPALISTPTTSGLFGGLSLQDERGFQAMSLYDLSRNEIKKGRVLRGTEALRGRYRIARLEAIPSTTAKQVEQLRMFLQAALRLGRPVHIFRGLPTAQPAFFYSDALPPLLVNLLGGQALRLEQIPTAITELELAHTLLDTPGLGYEVLRLYASPQTRLGGIALAWCVLHDRDHKTRHVLQSLQSRFHDATKELISMSHHDAPLIRLAQAAAEIQRYVNPSAAIGRQLMVFKLGFEALESARASGINDRDSLINGAAGEIQLNLERRDEQAKRGAPLVEGCLQVATILVDEIWLGLCKGRSPTQRQRRIMSSIYRMTLLQSYRQRYAENSEAAKETETRAV